MKQSDRIQQTPWTLDTLLVHGSSRDALTANSGKPTVEPINPSTTYIHRDAETLDQAFNGQLPSGETSYVYARQGNPNAQSLENLLAEIEGGVGATVFASGMAAIHAALLTAGLTAGTKILAAQDLYGYQYFVAYGLPILRARPFNHFGPRQTSTFVIANFARQIALIEAEKAEPVLSVGNLQARRDFLPVEDVVAAYLAIAEQGRPGEAYNIGSGQARSIRAMLDLLLTFARRSIQLREDPARLRPVDVPLLEADTSRLRADTNWRPAVQFELALQRTLDYWRTVVTSD